MTKLIYKPERAALRGEAIFWKLFTTDGIRFTPDVLETAEMVKRERNIRDIRYSRLPVSFQYFMD